MSRYDDSDTIDVAQSRKGWPLDIVGKRGDQLLAVDHGGRVYSRGRLRLIEPELADVLREMAATLKGLQESAAFVQRAAEAAASGVLGGGK